MFVCVHMFINIIFLKMGSWPYLCVNIIAYITTIAPIYLLHVLNCCVLLSYCGYSVVFVFFSITGCLDCLYFIDRVIF